jgi:hypothetical protein
MILGFFDLYVEFFHALLKTTVILLHVMVGYLQTLTLFCYLLIIRISPHLPLDAFGPLRSQLATQAASILRHDFHNVVHALAADLCPVQENLSCPPVPPPVQCPSPPPGSFVVDVLQWTLSFICVLAFILYFKEQRALRRHQASNPNPGSGGGREASAAAAPNVECAA